MARGGGVRGEKRCEGREKWEMKREKEEKHAESTKEKKKVGNEKLGEKFLREEKKIWGESLSY